MVDSNNGKDDTNKGKLADKPGAYSDDILRLVEETDKDGALSYCVECCKTGDLLYSSNSKPQAYSYCEGYRARNNSDDTKPPKPKAGNNDKGDNDDKGGNNSNSPSIDPSKVARQRKVF
jgi:hypothetical protein